jgi:hypothetical protein
MSPRLALLLSAGLFAATLAAAPEPAASAAKLPAIETGPAIGWVFPVFTDKEGYHLLTLRGANAKIDGPDKIDVTGFSAVVFSGDATERVDTVLISPQASFFPKVNRATGTSTVRLIHDDIEVTGVGWTYDHTSKKVSLAHDVRVTFHAQLNDILK